MSASFKFLLQRKGRTATLKKSTGSSYDPATGQNTHTYDEYEVKAYFAEYMLGEKSYNEVAEGQRWVSMSVTDILGATLPRPSTEDLIENAEDTVVVTNVQTIYSGENLICYLCTVKE